MRRFLTLTIFFFACLNSQSQNLAGAYRDSGYFFHPSAPRVINSDKIITQVSINRYQLDLGDLGSSGYAFQFDVDGSNNLVNWSAVGSAPVAPASGFMTTDNPGGFAFTVTPLPGTTPYTQNVYNNTYNHATKTFYLHYGYAVGSSGQNGYSRQIYEQLTFITPPEIHSVVPLTGTAHTQITITGKGFASVTPYNGISVGNINTDSAVIVSDSIILAWLSSGANGNVIVKNIYVNDTFPGFTYTPISTPNISPWQYLGTAGFSQNSVSHVNLSVNKYNMPYVVFSDSADGKAKVKKYLGSWIDIGGAVSPGKCGLTKMILDTTGSPIVAYVDSTIGGYLVIKKFDGSNWVSLNVPQPAPPRYFTLAVDKFNNIYLPYNYENDTTIGLYKYTNGTWENTYSIGCKPITGSDFSMAVNKENIPFILFVDNSLPANRGRVSVKRLVGTSWEYAGTAGFSNLVSTLYYPSISVDTSGNPVVSFQDDSSFQRLSAYTFDGTNWSDAIGKSFSKSHSHYASLSVDKRNAASVVFIDSSFNARGTVLTFNKINGIWKTAGNRGFLPCRSLEPNAMVTDENNNILIAFSDISQNGKVSVMKLVKDFLWIGSVSNAWENPANWNSEIVPDSSANVFIDAGANVVLSSNVAVNSITVSPGASFTILPSFTLTVTGP